MMSNEVKYDLPRRQLREGGHRWLSGLVVLVIGAIGGFVIRPLLGSGTGTEPLASPAAHATLLNHDELTALAETLERNQLYAEAARAWELAAEQTPPQGAAKAETLFRIGKNLSLAHEHERALSYLFAAETADEDEKWKTSISKLVLEGLSALGREDVRAHQAAKRIALDAGADEAPKKVAEIGGEPITEVDLQSFARRVVTQQLSMQRGFMTPEAFEEAIGSGLDHFKTPEGRRQLLRGYLSQELLYREALAAGLPDDVDVRRRTVDARRQILTDAFLSDYLERNLHVGQTDLENAYEARRTEYVEPEAFKVEAIVVEVDDARQQASEALDAGTGFAEVRESFSTLKPEPDKPDPFDRWITRDGRVPLAADNRATLAHLLTLETGEVSGKWFEGVGGKWLRFRLAERRPARQLALEECRDRVERALRAGKQNELLEQLQQSLQRKYQVVIHEDAEQSTQPSEEGV